MKDGYYLSTFVAYDPLANEMGVKLRHDQNVSLWKKEKEDVTLVKYWELERITGKKQHSDTFHSKEDVLGMLSHLLKEENLELKDIQEIWGTSGLENEKKFHHTDEISFHSIAHVFSSLFVQGSDVFQNNNIIALAADCGPDNLWEDAAFEKDFYAGAVSINGKIELFPISSPGHLWSHAKKRLGLREGTLMALATASSSCFLNAPQPAFEKEKIVNRYHWPVMSDYIDELILHAEDFTDADTGSTFTGFDPKFSKSENIASMVMKEVQALSNRIMKRNVDHVLEQYQLNPKDTILALSGGFCLNCPSNSFLMESFGFKDLLAPPCINDAGISLGQALYYFYHESNQKMNVEPLSAYQGQEFDDPDFNADKLKPYVQSVSEFSKRQFTQDVQEHPIVWFNGRSELGPRALGNRSLLSDPRTLEMKDTLNRIKKREWWRPVAPAVLEDKMSAFFLKEKRSPFMLELVEVKEDLCKKIPAVCHLDTTARIQTLSAQDNPVLYNAISGFYEETGIPLLCNTSLNDNNEPIINSFDEALNFSLRKKIKVMYVNGKRVELKNHDAYPADKPLARNTDYLRSANEAVSNTILNPLLLSKDEITVYWDYKNSLGENALSDTEKAQKIRSMTQSIKQRYGYLAR